MPVGAVRAALERESENAMMMANRFPLHFPAPAQRDDVRIPQRWHGRAAHRCAACVLLVTIGNTIVLRKHEPVWSMAFNYLVVVLDCSEARMSGKLYLLDALLKRPIIVTVVGLITIYSIYRAVSMVRRLADAAAEGSAFSVLLSRDRRRNHRES